MRQYLTLIDFNLRASCLSRGTSPCWIYLAICVCQYVFSIAMKLTSIGMLDDSIASTRITFFMFGSNVKVSTAKVYAACFLLREF